ncbi:hypothetical protein BDN70DRAFT_930710 [Pholiota conissans]|uniref:Uncharacterized protein n=1 Tax=Pholiota conissans TaxID=109636 RepID=A0A9P6D2N4_9AGAR|nr:hypothetical protein BDN70DRAFT_930710 [Pholiota conissans]
MSKVSLPEVIFHYVLKQGIWSAKFTDVIAWLLPLRILKQDRNGMSPHAAKMYEEVMARSLFSQTMDMEDEDSEDSPRKRLAGMLDTILMTIHLLRSYTAQITDQPRSTHSIWTSLFALLGEACYKDSYNDQYSISLAIDDSSIVEPPAIIQIKDVDNGKIGGGSLATLRTAFST